MHEPKHTYEVAYQVPPLRAVYLLTVGADDEDEALEIAEKTLKHTDGVVLYADLVD